jgi:hypothetical protein
MNTAPFEGGRHHYHRRIIDWRIGDENRFDVTQSAAGTRIALVINHDRNL